MSAVLNVVWRPEPFCSACRCYRHCHGKRRR
jgi:hypothetical protein